MLTNEQRAHDLTISALSYLMSNQSNTVSISLNGVDTAEDGSRHLDIFKMYVDLYNQTLDSMNREFSK
ncbi:MULTISPECIES: hypothetical protein [Clostridium]|jgi:YbbR domain-containing protein|uniref:hypothetical protein n=1 Tax=Clostridium TaxID=1485 RepID=UPI000DD0397E|nr:hypothetical protein [Clostridium tertium]MBU6137386.1 hypothetical protein [Clostridium tertium]